MSQNPPSSRQTTGCCTNRGGCGSAPLGAVIPLVLRVALGGLMIFSGVMKVGRDFGLPDPAMSVADFYAAINGFQLGLGHAATSFLAYAVPWVELITGLLLVVGYMARGAALIVSLMMIAFGAGLVSVLVRELDVNCSCFGKLRFFCDAAISECHVIRNAIMACAGFVIMGAGPGMLAADSALGRRQAG